MYKIRLQAVDSREATDEELTAAKIEPDQYPEGWRIMAHQAATVAALRTRNAPIVINRALTGDGKTLAGQFRFFADKTRTLTMYPTNELANDQKRGLDAILREWTPPRWSKRKPRVEVLNSEQLDEATEKINTLSRLDTLNTFLRNDNLLLTNPDMFHLMMQFGYKQFGTSRDLVLGAVMQHFNLFVFDEFHLFDTPQTAAAMIAILLALQIGEVDSPPRFLLLSATPQALLLHLAGKVGLQVESIEGQYQHGLTTTPDGWRRILRPVTLHLHAGKLEDWIVAHFEDVIVAFFKRNSSRAKAVIICNSVATAHRIFTYLEQACAKAGLKPPGINTGLTPRKLRNFEDVELLVATSTVDVGVDFRINLLIFESMNASSHIQRLGRLGRHDKDSAGNPFNEFEAHGLLPEWVITALEKEIPADSETDRECYNKTISRDDIYPQQQTFSSYIQQWAGIQSTHVIAELNKYDVATQYQTYRDALMGHFKKLFPRGYPRYMSLMKANQSEILDEAKSFRGGSPFTALVQDMTSKDQGIVAYNLITLLRHGELVSAPLEELLADARRQRMNIKALERAEPLAGYRLHGWLTTPRPIEIYTEYEVDETQFEVVTELKRIRLSAPGVPELIALNDALEARTLVVLLVRNFDPETLRMKLRLGVQLELFRFHTGDGSEGCAVFGRDALLLDSVLYRFRKTESSRPIIC